MMNRDFSIHYLRISFSPRYVFALDLQDLMTLSPFLFTTGDRMKVARPLSPSLSTFAGALHPPDAVQLLSPQRTLEPLLSLASP